MLDARRSGRLPSGRHAHLLAILLAAVALGPSELAAGQPYESEAQVEALLDEEEDHLRQALKDYNKQHRLATSNSGRWTIMSLNWTIDRIAGERVFLFVNYYVGQVWNPQPADALFEVSWDGERFQFHSHVRGAKPPPKVPRVLSTSVGRGCVYNHYHSRACVDAKRRWQEFVALHDLEPTPETAAIFQAYKENDKGTGDRLMALARGLPDPGGKSVFTLQSEVDRLNLRRFQRAVANPCDLNPYGPRPCLEVLQAYEAFVDRHGLTQGRAAASMFESYTQGDYRRADVIYALASGKPVPAYGYLPTGVARDPSVSSALRIKSSVGGNIPCDISPYGRRPCPGTARLWREFAATYELADTAQSARIFAAYAEGEVKQGDQLLAAAKGVSLEQLQEAAGQPQGGLVIEVYPGDGKAGRS